MGQDASLLEEAIDGRVDTHRAKDMAGAVTLAAGLARQGDVVLLSPACASFDMYSGFAERGEDFTARVEKLGVARG